MKYQKCLNTDKTAIVGFGSALLDMLLHEKDAFIEKCYGMKAKGGMTYVEDSFYDKTLALTHEKPTIVPGGSACNTISGIGRLGKRARFVGKCGNDEMGALLKSDLVKQRVEPDLLSADTSTGKVLSVITPDAQRSMFTFLGASAELGADDITPNHFDNAMMIHVEGYLLFNESLIREILAQAKKAGVVVSLDLASFTVVEAAKGILKALINDYVDILIANDDESYAFTGESKEEKAILSLGELADIVVINRGAKGSLITCQKEMVQVDAIQAEDIVDTTGAGDLWTAGFLYGLSKGWSIKKAGALGTLLGYEVCRVVGTKLSDDAWARIEWFTKNGI